MGRQCSLVLTFPHALLAHVHKRLRLIMPSRYNCTSAPLSWWKRISSAAATGSGVGHDFNDGCCPMGDSGLGSGKAEADPIGSCLIG